MFFQHCLIDHRNRKMFVHRDLQFVKYATCIRLHYELAVALEHNSENHTIRHAAP